MPSSPTGELESSRERSPSPATMWLICPGSQKAQKATAWKAHPIFPRPRPGESLLASMPSAHLHYTQLSREPRCISKFIWARNWYFWECAKQMIITLQKTWEFQCHLFLQKNFYLFLVNSPHQKSLSWVLALFINFSKYCRLRDLGLWIPPFFWQSLAKFACDGLCSNCWDSFLIASYSVRLKQFWQMYAHLMVLHSHWISRNLLINPTKSMFSKLLSKVGTLSLSRFVYGFSCESLH